MSDVSRRVDIAVMAKAPIAGWAKTRLIPVLGAAGAARLQRRLTCRAVQLARQAGIGEVKLWCAPDASHRFFRALSRAWGVDGRNQVEGDLGVRMAAVFERQPRGVPLLLIGTDCPPMTVAHLRAAADALRAGHDAALLPVEDGGYALIGLGRPLPALFRDIAWSTDRVMSVTRERLRALDARWHEGDTLWDVDRPDDLARLAAHEHG